MNDGVGLCYSVLRVRKLRQLWHALHLAVQSLPCLDPLYSRQLPVGLPVGLPECLTPNCRYDPPALLCSRTILPFKVILKAFWAGC